MNSTIAGAIVFACLFGAGLLGMRVRAALPEHHLTADTKDAVRIGMGLVATMAALVLGLLVASTKGAYDTQKSEVMQMAAKIVSSTGYWQITVLRLRRPVSSFVARSGVRSIVCGRTRSHLKLRNWIPAYHQARRSLTQSRSSRHRTTCSALSSLKPCRSPPISVKCAGCCSSRRKRPYPFLC
jgi:hypothetical protein